MTNNESLVTAVERPHPARSERAAYPVAGAGLARFGDVGANGHLNNLALAELHENARAEFNTRAFPGVYRQAGRDIRVVVANSVLHYLAEFPEINRDREQTGSATGGRRGGGGQQ